MTRYRSTRSGPFGGSAGFSLIELTAALAIIGILSASAVMMLPNAIQTARADGGMTQVIAELRLAKDRAITERRDMEVRFVAPNEIQIWRQEVPVALGRTLVHSIRLENRIEFVLMAGVPDTPDGFGNDSAVDFEDATTLFFRSEGMFTDANANLDPINGTVFLGVPFRPETARAVTVFGPTALIRGFRWVDQQWVD